jgi:putative SOS response-associated peptidase YedK
MCGRYLFTEAESEDIRNIVNDIENRMGEGTVKLGEIFPTDRVPALIAQKDTVQPDLLTWGFPGFRGKSVVINARSETAHEKPMFRNSLVYRRCIIPSTGFFEWGPVITESSKVKYGEEVPDGDSQISLWQQPASKKSKKQKYLFNLPGEEALYMAGLYNVFEGENRFVILTTKANSSVVEVHNRMPLVLRKDLIDDWLLNDELVSEILLESPTLKKVAV